MDVLPIRVTHIFLDVDGTLVDFQVSLQAGSEAAAAYLSEQSEALITPRALQEARQRIAPDTRAGHSELRLRIFRQILRERGIDDERIAQQALALDLAARHEALVAYDDAVAALEELRARDLKLIAATNGGGSFGRTSLPGLLHGSWTAEDAGVPKPHPDFFNRALKWFGAEARTSLMVGDRLDNDIEPAHSVGMPAILLDRYGDHETTPPPARALIHTLAELPALVVHAEAE